ncbi:interactor of HORMAD1 protein 1 [Erpetoichthys calabaricus]|uniref:Interactor of HORMAD1 1 n=1 Tax=Erpetoichthys calabaricus TaxID=27687 RepID=A0A8C4XEW8_ERPCA|nr:interactor of HORMAD1 protein 1 [Erpetoichthys calabaricus]
MNLNVLNIKEVLSIPPGARTFKPSSRSNNPSDYSSLSDSQLLYGSQVCNDYSQSQEVNFYSRPSSSSQHSSQEFNEPRFSTKYQSKPHLFGGDYTEKNKGSYYEKSKGILEQFEVMKKKAKEKEESEFLHNGLSHIHTSIDGMKLCLGSIEENTSFVKKFLLENLDGCAKTLQEKLSSYYESVQSTLTSQHQSLQEIEQTEISIKSETFALKSVVTTFQENMENIRLQICRDHQEVCEKLKILSNMSQYDEILSVLNELTSTFRPTCKLKDNFVQTSPELLKNVCLVSEHKTYFENHMLDHAKNTLVVRTPEKEKLLCCDSGEYLSQTKNSKVKRVYKSTEISKSLIPEIVKQNCIHSVSKDESRRLKYQYASNRDETFPVNSGEVTSVQDTYSNLSQEKQNKRENCNKKDTFWPQKHLNTPFTENMHSKELDKDMYDIYLKNTTSQPFKCKTKPAFKDCRSSNSKTGFKKGHIRNKEVKKKYRVFSTRKNAKSSSLTFSQGHHDKCKLTDDGDINKYRSYEENTVRGLSFAGKQEVSMFSEVPQRPRVILPVSYIGNTLIDDKESVKAEYKAISRMPNKQNNMVDAFHDDDRQTRFITLLNTRPFSWLSPMSPVLCMSPVPVVVASTPKQVKEKNLHSRFYVLNFSDDSD